MITSLSSKNPTIWNMSSLLSTVALSIWATARVMLCAEGQKLRWRAPPEVRDNPTRAWTKNVLTHRLACCRRQMAAGLLKPNPEAGIPKMGVGWPSAARARGGGNALSRLEDNTF